MQTIANPKHCQKCDTDKPADEFTAGKTACKPCEAARMRDYRAANRGRSFSGTHTPTALVDPDVTFRHRGRTITLSPNRYPATDRAQLPDDGILDTVAVRRLCEGDRTIRVTGREIAAARHVLAADGFSDADIAAVVNA